MCLHGSCLTLCVMMKPHGKGFRGPICEERGRAQVQILPQCLLLKDWAPIYDDWGWVDLFPSQAGAQADVPGATGVT